MELGMLDSVASFLWADAAGNEVMTESDGSMPSSFAGNFAPLRFLDGWGICTPTSDSDFAGMCRAFGVSGPDVDSILHVIARRSWSSPIDQSDRRTRCWLSGLSESHYWKESRH